MSPHTTVMNVTCFIVEISPNTPQYVRVVQISHILHEMTLATLIQQVLNRIMHWLS